MSKVIVTGSCGFIGHHLVRELKQIGYHVIGIDNLSTGKVEWKSLAHQFIQQDINNLTAEIFENVKYVFHTAALAKVPLSIEQPYLTHNTNVNGTLNLLLLAKSQGVEKVIYSASSSAYGNQPTLPLNEGMLPKPENPYAVQKLVGEYYCKVFANIYHLPTISLRYFNVFGEEQPADNPYTGVITRFFDLKTQNKPLTIYGNGEQTRDFTYVKDIVRANILAAQSTTYGIFNIGAGKRYSINQVADFIGGKKQYLPARIGDPLHTLADNSLARFLLDWQPTVDLETWIKKQ